MKHASEFLKIYAKGADPSPLRLEVAPHHLAERRQSDRPFLGPDRRGAHGIIVHYHDDSSAVAPVRCSSCRYSTPLRCAPEVVLCSQLNRSKNAELLRHCDLFDAK